VKKIFSLYGINFSYRTYSVLAVIFSAALFLCAEHIALHTYNSFCKSGDRFFTIDPPQTVGIGFLVALIPAIIVRTKNATIGIFSLSLLTLVYAFSLIITANTPPLECITMGGNYDDKVSGIMMFIFWYLILTSLSYLISIFDFIIWTFKTYK
jgi:hypothetical protein